MVMIRMMHDLSDQCLVATAVHPAGECDDSDNDDPSNRKAASDEDPKRKSEHD